MAQPAVADVRVSCPACGGPIHPIAGRCKHCRTDLVAVRGGATGAQGTLIQIGQLGAVVAPRASATAAPLVTPASSSPIGLPHAAPALAPPVALSSAVAASPRGRWTRRWPLLVAAIAAIAIVASIAVLLLGDDGKTGRKRRSLGPSPDRMRTDQLPTDPWARGSGAPSAGAIVPPNLAPDLGDDLRTPDGFDPDDIPPPPPPDDEEHGVLGGVVEGTTAPAPGSPAAFFDNAIDATCQRLAACWGDANATAVCDQGRAMLQQQRSVVDTLCPRLDQVAAASCLQQLASLPCPDQAATPQDLITMAYGLDPCMRSCER